MITPKEREARRSELRRLMMENPEMGAITIARKMGLSRGNIRDAYDAIRREIRKTEPPSDPVKIASGKAIKFVKEELEKNRPSFGYLPVEYIDSSQWITVGLVADTHLGCREERLDALHSQYDLFAREGITTVFHAGNMVDGFVPKINVPSVHCCTPDDQAMYVVDNYPARDGITTYYITGDDHEGWWIKEGINWGAYLQMICEREGRRDLRYMGHVEADVEYKGPGGSIRIKVQHPGGGSAYARSYAGQKQVESFQGGEKPHILVQGHYHVNNHMNDRNIHVIMLPGFEDQTIFARKKKLRMEVGGAILKFKPCFEGSAVSRVSVEFNMFFDRGFYKAYLRSDTRLNKGHVVFNQ